MTLQAMPEVLPPGEPALPVGPPLFDADVDGELPPVDDGCVEAAADAVDGEPVELLEHPAAASARTVTAIDVYRMLTPNLVLRRQRVLHRGSRFKPRREARETE
jgi:anti-sigma factor RsiW